MGKSGRIIVLVVGLLSVFAASGVAAAASWTNTGDTAFTATTGPFTISANSVSLTCTSGTLTDTVGTSNPGPTWVGAMTGTFTGAGCRLAGVPVSFSCTTSLDLGSWSAGPPGVSAGTLNWRSPCTATGGCDFSGGMILGVRYRNPIAPSTAGRIDAVASSTLRVGGAGCLMGAGSATITALTFTITAASGGAASPHLGPIITQP